MRKFDDFEKSIIKKIVEIENIPGSLVVLGNVLDNILDSNYYIEIFSESECSAFILRNYFDHITNTYGTSAIGELTKTIENTLLTVTNLLIYLEKENYIELRGELNLKILGLKIGGFDYISYEIKDVDLNKLIYKITRAKIFPQKKLKDLVINKFKTEEEIIETRKYNQNRILTLITAGGVIVSVITLIVTMLISNNSKPIKVIILNKSDSIHILNDTMRTILIESQIDSSNLSRIKSKEEKKLK